MIGNEVLPNGWLSAPVQELFGLVGGGTPSTAVAEYWTGDTPWITSADIDDEHHIVPRRFITEQAIQDSAANKVPAGSAVVVTRVGLGKVGLAPTALCFSQDSQALLFNPKLLDPRYVLHYMGQAVGVFKHISRGTTISGVTKKQLASLNFLFPPFAEQQRIVDEIEKQFTRLDAAVAALTRVRADLKRYRASVLKAACEGRLVSAEAELARKEGRSYETGEQLLSRILKERRTKWEADQLAKMCASGKSPKDDDWKKKYREPDSPNVSNLPQLPDDWVWATVEQVSLRVQYGTSAKCGEFGEVAVLGMGNLTTDGRIVGEKLKSLPSDHPEFPELLLMPGDLLFNRTNSAELVGKSAVYKGLPNPCSFASYLIRAVTSCDCSSDYVAACLNSVYGRSWIKSVVNQQVGQANVNGSKLQAFTFPLPPIAEQRRIAQRIEEAFSLAIATATGLRDNLVRADRLRQSILKRAFEGKLVPQDRNDEPASALLERIRAERAARTDKISKKTTRQRKPKAPSLLFEPEVV